MCLDWNRPAVEFLIVDMNIEKTKHIEDFLTTFNVTTDNEFISIVKRLLLVRDLNTNLNDKKNIVVKTKI